MNAVTKIIRGIGFSLTLVFLSQNASAFGFLLFAGQATISEDAAMEAAKSGNDGRVLDVMLDEAHSPKAYKVKMLSEDGVVRTILIDAETGKTLE